MSYSIQVVADGEGSIIGAALRTSDVDDERRPVGIEISALDGQSRSTIEIPDELGRLDTVELWMQLKTGYRLSAESGGLVRRDTAS